MYHFKGNKVPGVIKTSGSESRGQEEAAYASVFAGLRDYYGELFTRPGGRSKFFKCCTPAAITAIA